jgi:hypothetical protein
MRIVSGVALAAVCVTLTAVPALGQDLGWQDRWYWGAQGSILRYKTPTQTSWSTAYGVGGSWFITKRQGGLYLAFDQMFYDDGTTSAVANGLSPTGFTSVQFDRSQRWQALVYAVPWSGAFQVYLGLGFELQNVTNADTVSTGTETTQEIQSALVAIEEARSAAFLALAGGIQLSLGRLAVYGDYHYMPSSDSFLITSSQHTFMAGLRFALTSSRTEVTTHD